jgi:hypothetical protein
MTAGESICSIDPHANESILVVAVDSHALVILSEA